MDATVLLYSVPYHPYFYDNKRYILHYNSEIYIAYNLWQERTKQMVLLANRVNGQIIPTTIQIVSY